MHSPGSGVSLSAKCMPAKLQNTGRVLLQFPDSLVGMHWHKACKEVMQLGVLDCAVALDANNEKIEKRPDDYAADFG